MPVTARGHESDKGDRVTANGHGDLPGEQGNANAVGATGSDQKTATGHVESGLGETGLPESERDTTGSGPKTPSTSWVVIPVPRRQKSATFSAPQPRTNP